MSPTLRRTARSAFPLAVAAGFASASWEASHLGHAGMFLIAILGSIGAWSSDFGAALPRWQRAWPELRFLRVKRFPTGDAGVDSLCRLCAVISPVFRSLEEDRPREKGDRVRQNLVRGEFEALIAEGAALCVQLDRLLAAPDVDGSLRRSIERINTRLDAIAPAMLRLHGALVRTEPVRQLGQAPSIDRLAQIERDLSARLDSAEELEGLRCVVR